MKPQPTMPPLPKMGRPVKYIFDKLEVGQHFFEAGGNFDSIRRTCYRHNIHGKHFTAHSVRGGVEVWRRS